MIINGNNNIVDDNTVNENMGVGLSVTGGIGNQITANTFSTNNLGGISLSNSTGIISGNTVTGNMSFGISLMQQTTIHFKDNEVSGNSSHGLIINGSGNDINNNSIYNNGVSGTGVGVFVESGNYNSILTN